MLWLRSVLLHVLASHYVPGLHIIIGVYILLDVCRYSIIYRLYFLCGILTEVRKARVGRWKEGVGR